MNNAVILRVVALLVCSFVSAMSVADGYSWQGVPTYKVTITNVTKGQNFTPFIVASHKPGLHFFTLGEMASPEISRIAEGGDIAPLMAVLEASPMVKDIATTSGLLGAGDSVEVMVEAWGPFRKLSLAAMLVPTNDTFISLDAVSLPKFGSVTYLAHAYDAGSETNDESCATIPGPHCGGEPFSPYDDGEGFVHISAGISGAGEVDPALYDWRGPVAKVVIERM